MPDEFPRPHCRLAWGKHPTVNTVLWTVWDSAYACSVKNTLTLQHGQSAAAQGKQGRSETDPPHRRLVSGDEKVTHLASSAPLPCPAYRQQIIDRANLVLSEARVLVEQLDRTSGYERQRTSHPPNFGA
jgi:hypothetical protein